MQLVTIARGGQRPVDPQMGSKEIFVRVAITVQQALQWLWNAPKAQPQLKLANRLASNALTGTRVETV